MPIRRFFIRDGVERLSDYACWKCFHPMVQEDRGICPQCGYTAQLYQHSVSVARSEAAARKSGGGSAAKEPGVPSAGAVPDQPSLPDPQNR